MGKCSLILCACLSYSLPCSLSSSSPLLRLHPPSLWASGSLPPSLGGSGSSSLGVRLPPLLWLSGLSPPPLVSPSSLSFRLYLPPRRPGPLFLSPCPPCRLRVTPSPAPCRAGSQSAVPPASLSWAGWGIPPGSWKKQLVSRERPSVSLGAHPPPSGLGVSPRVRPARGRKPCGFWLLPGGLRIWPPPPGQQPKYYSAGGVGGSGRRPRLKEAFRAARPGASCPQAQASGRPSGDLRWPEGRVLL